MMLISKFGQSLMYEKGGIVKIIFLVRHLTDVTLIPRVLASSNQNSSL